MNALLIVLALLLGAAGTSQGVVNGSLAQRLPIAGAILVNALVTLAGAALWWAVAPGATRRLVPEGGAPSWCFTGGLLGLYIVSSAAFCFPRLGAGPTMALVVAAQLVVALAYDHFGVGAAPLPVTPMRFFGALLLVAGALLVLWPRIARG